MKTATGANHLVKGSTWSAYRLEGFSTEAYFFIPFGMGSSILAHEKDIEVL